MKGNGLASMAKTVMPIVQCHNLLTSTCGCMCTLWGPKLSLENVLVCRKYIDLKGLVSKAKYL